MKKSFYPLLFLVNIFLFSSCKEENNKSAYLPKEGFKTASLEASFDSNLDNLNYKKDQNNPDYISNIIDAESSNKDSITMIQNKVESNNNKDTPKQEDNKPEEKTSSQEEDKDTIDFEKTPDFIDLGNSIMVAFYGHPNSTRMGILGENKIDIMTNKLKAQVAKYQKITKLKVIPSYHIIYATVWADANVGIISDEIALKYIEYAKKNEIIVFLDHQLGKNTVSSSVKTMLPFLVHQNVHLAIDPEWSTRMPSKEIGSITGEDVNIAQNLMQDYMSKNSIKGKKILVVHQFKSSMIRGVNSIKTYSKIDLIHNMDGFGHPSLKMNTWNFVKTVKNIKYKGFKLFYPKKWKKIGFDSPLLSESEVLNLDPIPRFINYQ